MSRRGHLPKCSKTENENNIDLKVDLKIYPKDDFRNLITTIKKCKTLVITRVGESNLYSFLGGNGRGTPCKLSGFQESDKLINEEWHTKGIYGTNEYGVANINGFKGDYDLEFSYSGKNYTKSKLDGRYDCINKITLD